MAHVWMEPSRIVLQPSERKGKLVQQSADGGTMDGCVHNGV